MQAVVGKGVAAALWGPYPRLKCKELKARLGQHLSEAVPTATSRCHPDRKVRSKVCQLEQLVGVLRDDVVTARAGRRESDVLTEV